MAPGGQPPGVAVKGPVDAWTGPKNRLKTRFGAPGGRMSGRPGSRRPSAWRNFAGGRICLTERGKCGIFLLWLA